MISTKAAATMHYIHLQGSPTQRRAIRDEKVKAFAKEMDEAFEGKAFLTKKKLQALVKKHTQGLSVKVKRLPDWLSELMNIDAEVTRRWFIFNRGMDILLPFKKRNGFGAIIENGAKEKELLKHEMSHIFTTASIPNVLRFRIRDININAVDFYNEQLYKKHIYFNNIDEFKSAVTKAKVFPPPMRPSDRVEVLQKWRHCLSDERDAYKNGTENYREDDFSSRLHCSEQKIRILAFDFDDKIKFIKALILEERAKQVAGHKPISRHPPSTL